MAHRAILSVLAAGLTLPACALLLGAEELPEGGGAGGPGAGGSASAGGGAAGGHGTGAGPVGPLPCACAASGGWSEAFPVAGEVTVAGVVVDSHDNVIVAGSVRGSLGIGGLPPGGADRDVFVAKLDPCGVPIWAHRFGDGADQGALAIALDPRAAPSPDADAVVVSGFYAGTLDFGGGTAPLAAPGARAFVARLRSDGGASASASAPTGAARSTGVTVAGNGAVTWVGTDASGGTLFISRLDAPLETVDHHIAPACSGCTPAIAALAGGQVALAGGFRGTLDLTAGPGGSLKASGGADAFAAVLATAPAAQYKLVRGQRFGDQADQAITALAPDVGGGVFVTGAFAGTLDLGGPAKHTSAGGNDAFVARLDPQLDASWAVFFGDWQEQRGTAVAARGARLALAGDFAGQLAVPAGTTLTSRGDADAFLALFDLQGNPLYAESFGSTGADHGAGVALSDTHAVLAAVVSGPVPLACGTVGGSGPSLLVVRRALP